MVAGPPTWTREALDERKGMRLLRLAVVLVVAILPLLPAQPCHTAPGLEPYGTFHAMGIIVQLSAGDDRDGVGLRAARLNLNVLPPRFA
jgi:hypothetical protein